MGELANLVVSKYRIPLRASTLRAFSSGGRLDIDAREWQQSLWTAKMCEWKHELEQAMLTACKEHGFRDRTEGIALACSDVSE